VFLNRLRQNMRLQSDPTILYGLFGGKVAWGRPIQKTDIGQKTSHNTYQIDGLPPTPICNPGRRSIEAVLQPRETKELYFVADGNGGHVFAETLKDHNANVQKWRLVEKDLKAKAAPEPAAEEATAKMRPALKQRAAARARADMKAAPGSEPAPDDLIAFCRGRIASFKIPRRVFVVDELPMTPSGKVQKAQLRDEARERLG